jgi:hypothetical protein
LRGDVPVEVPSDRLRERRNAGDAFAEVIAAHNPPSSIGHIS